MDIFKEIINKLSPLLKKMGFDKKGNNFYLEENKNFAVVNFQKSRESTKEIVSFTINFGLYSDVLGRTQYCYNNSVKPEIEKCHWQARIGNFMPNSPDYWWEVNLSSDLNDIASNIFGVIETIIMPEINKRISDEGLINCWINESFAGTTEIGRFKYLTTLLKSNGDFNTLNRVIENFIEKSEGKPNANIAREHLKDIEYIYKQLNDKNDFED